MSRQQLSLGVTIEREDLERWAGRELTDDEVTYIQTRVPHSPIPQAIEAIVDQIDPDNTGHNDTDASAEGSGETTNARSCQHCTAAVRWDPDWGAWRDSDDDVFCPDGRHHLPPGETLSRVQPS